MISFPGSCLVDLIAATPRKSSRIDLLLASDLLVRRLPMQAVPTDLKNRWLKLQEFCEQISWFAFQGKHGRLPSDMLQHLPPVLLALGNEVCIILESLAPFVLETFEGARLVALIRGTPNSQSIHTPPTSSSSSSSENNSPPETPRAATPTLLNQARQSSTERTWENPRIGQPYFQRARRKRKSNTQLPEPIEGQYCHDCGAVQTPEWRRGPNGPKTLCNACGLQYAKKLRADRIESNGHAAVTIDANDSAALRDTSSISRLLNPTDTTSPPTTPETSPSAATSPRTPLNYTPLPPPPTTLPPTLPTAPSATAAVISLPSPQEFLNTLNPTHSPKGGVYIHHAVPGGLGSAMLPPLNGLHRPLGFEEAVRSLMPGGLVSPSSLLAHPRLSRPIDGASI